jgi:hypothetical protein
MESKLKAKFRTKTIYEVIRKIGRISPATRILITCYLGKIWIKGNGYAIEFNEFSGDTDGEWLIDRSVLLDWLVFMRKTKIEEFSINGNVFEAVINNAKITSSHVSMLENQSFPFDKSDTTPLPAGFQDYIGFMYPVISDISYGYGTTWTGDSMMVANGFFGISKPMESETYISFDNNVMGILHQFRGCKNGRISNVDIENPYISLGNDQYTVYVAINKNSKTLGKELLSVRDQTKQKTGTTITVSRLVLKKEIDICSNIPHTSYFIMGIRGSEIKLLAETNNEFGYSGVSMRYESAIPVKSDAEDWVFRGFTTAYLKKCLEAEKSDEVTIFLSNNTKGDLQQSPVLIDYPGGSWSLLMPMYMSDEKIRDFVSRNT